MITFRPATSDDDRAFIVATWSASYKASHYAGLLWTDDYATVMHAQLERVLERAETTAIVACDSDDPGFLYGHIVGEVEQGDTPIVHYAFVKAPYRRTGIAHRLLDALGVNPWNYFVYSCKTGVVSDIRTKIPRARFDPNGIRYARTNRRRAL